MLNKLSSIGSQSGKRTKFRSDTFHSLEDGVEVIVLNQLGPAERQDIRMHLTTLQRRMETICLLERVGKIICFLGSPNLAVLTNSRLAECERGVCAVLGATRILRAYRCTGPGSSDGCRRASRVPSRIPSDADEDVSKAAI